MSESVPAPQRPPSGLQSAFICLALGLAILAVYGQTSGHGFINYDDDVYVYDNPAVKAGLTPRGALWAFTTFTGAHWHPLTWLSHMLDCQCFGLHAGAHHLVSVSWHWAGACLLFLAFARMTRQPWRSAWLAGIFALHPLHVESVAWIAERKDVLSTCLGLGSLWCYARYAEAPSRGRYAWTAVLFAFSLLAKPMLVTLPFIFLLLDFWPLRRLAWPPSPRDLARLLAEKLPLLALSAASSLATLLAQRGSALVSLDELPFALRLANAGIAYVSYLAKAFWPAHLAVLYPLCLPAAGAAAAAGAGLAAATWAVLAWSRRKPYLLTGWFWFLGMLLPTIGLVQSGVQSIADRYMYLPIVGLAVMAAWTAGDLVADRALPRRVCGALAVLALGALGLAAHRQTRLWASPQSLYEHTLAVTERNFVIENNLGRAYEQAGQMERAIDMARKAVATKPDYFQAYNNLCAFTFEAGRPAQAVAACEKALALNADYAPAYNNLGAAYGQLGRYDQSIQTFKNATRLDARYISAHLNLGGTYVAVGDKGAYRDEYEALLRLDPDAAEKLRSYARTRWPRM